MVPSQTKWSLLIRYPVILFKRIQHKKSFFTLLGMLLVLLVVFFKYDLWHKNRITLDAPSYYTYLPASFIHHDLHLKFIDEDPAFYKDKIWYYTIENNRRLIKHPVGISVAMTPFFMIGHVFAKLSGGKQDGYSLSYQNAISIGIVFYLFLGLFLLRRLLLRFYSDTVVALTLLITLFGTNLLWYASFEAFMPHAISFSFLCMALFSFHSWIESKRAAQLILFSFLFALIVLIRPLAITIALYFFLFLLIQQGGWKSLLAFLAPQKKQLFFSVLLFVLMGSLQLCYWKYATGKWLYDVYIDEHFVFSSPQILLFLFSFRKGWLVYTPLMLIAIFGLLSIFKSHKAVFYSTILILLVSIYTLSSWWAWSYGICWGMRPMIDYYSLLSIPMAAGLVWMFERNKRRSYASAALVCLLIVFNLFQTWQYKNGLIHFDDMTRASYFKGLFQTKASSEWYDLLRAYQWDRRMEGKPQIEYSRRLLDGLDEKQLLYFRAGNLQFLSVNEKAQNAVAAFATAISPKELFVIQHLAGDTVCIRASNGLLLSVRSEYENVVTATGMFPGNTEKFLLNYLQEDDNLVALKALNGQYIQMDVEWPFILKANGNSIGKQSSFRFFMNDAH